uniref:Uncharacterized protein n=1 Tax=Tetradesmus obliquus TaxID=3088 RepID=A0A383VYH7_TETOB
MSLHLANNTHITRPSPPSGLLPRVHSTLSSRNGSFAVPKSGKAGDSFVVLTDRDSYHRYSADFEPAGLCITPVEACSPASSEQLIVRLGSQALPLSTTSYARSVTVAKDAACSEAQQQQQLQQEHQQGDASAVDFDAAAAQQDWDVVPSWSFSQPAAVHESSSSHSSSRPGMRLARQLYAEQQLQQLAELRREFGSQQQEQQQQQQQQQTKDKKIGKLLSHKLSSL